MSAWRQRLARSRSSARPVLTVLLCLLGALSGARSQADPVEDSAVKLAMVYNIGKFVGWPASALEQSSSQFVLCIYGGAEGLRPGIALIDGKPVQGRTLQVRTITVIREIRGCQILYLPDIDPAQLAPLLTAAQAQSVLTVSDGEHFAERGGDVALITQDNRVRFEINLLAAQNANLAVGSELLRLASKVLGATHP